MNKHTYLKRFLALFLSFVCAFTTVSYTCLNVSYASEEDTIEYTEEDFEDFDLTELTEDEEWDHETWDQPHQDQVWMTFSMTSWDSEFPSLQFSEGGYATSTGDTLLNEIDLITYDEIVEIIKTYRYRGQYTKVSEDFVYDQTAYVPIVVSVIAALRSYGYDDNVDPYNLKKYVSRGYGTYTTEGADRFLRSTRTITYRTMSALKGVNIYNTSLIKPYLNKIVQYGGTSKIDDDFADRVLSYYTAAIKTDEYIMDGFGNRLDSLGSNPMYSTGGGAGCVTGTINLNVATSAKGQSILAAAQTTPSPGKGYCAKWVSQVYQAAGLGYPGGNACDQYRQFCTSSDKGQLEPGMIIAVNTHGTSYNSRTYGHVGIYIGENKVIDNIGSIRTIPLDQWINDFGTRVTPRWGWAA